MALDGSESPLQAGGPERKVLPLRWAGLGRWGGSDCDPPGWQRRVSLIGWGVVDFSRFWKSDFNKGSRTLFFRHAQRISFKTYCFGVRK